MTGLGVRLCLAPPDAVSALGRIYVALGAAGGLPNSNSRPVTGIRFMVTASLRATATVGRIMPCRLAMETPPACSRDHLRVSAEAASERR